MSNCTAFHNYNDDNYDDSDSRYDSSVYSSDEEDDDITKVSDCLDEDEYFIPPINAEDVNLPNSKINSTEFDNFDKEKLKSFTNNHLAVTNPWNKPLETETQVYSLTDIIKNQEKEMEINKKKEEKKMFFKQKQKKNRFNFNNENGFDKSNKSSTSTSTSQPKKSIGSSLLRKKQKDNKKF